MDVRGTDTAAFQWKQRGGSSSNSTAKQPADAQSVQEEFESVSHRQKNTTGPGPTLSVTAAPVSQDTLGI